MCLPVPGNHSPGPDRRELFAHFIENWDHYILLVSSRTGTREPSIVIIFFNMLPSSQRTSNSRQMDSFSLSTNY